MTQTSVYPEYTSDLLPWLRVRGEEDNGKQFFILIKFGSEKGIREICNYRKLKTDFLHIYIYIYICNS
jgi:hypothetical protein